MKVVLGIAIVLLASDAVSARRYRNKSLVAEVFAKEGIVPDVIPVAPKYLLEVYFEDVKVYLGNEICSSEVINLTRIDFKYDPNCYYTFIICDPDVPRPEDPYWRFYLIGMYVNMVGSDFENARALAVYVPTTPIAGTGPHRFIFLVYKQINTIDIPADAFNNKRMKFSVGDFVAKYNYDEPVAGNFYVSEFPADYCCKDCCYMNT